MQDFIHSNSKYKQIVKIFKVYKSNIAIFDFDWTITTFCSDTSIGVFSKILNYEYQVNKKEIDKKINNSNNNFKILYYWNKKLKILQKNIEKNSILLASNYFSIRKDMKKIINYCKISNIKIIICSSGYYDLIKYILEKNHIQYDYLIANKLDSKLSNTITPYNKKNFLKKILKHELNIILFGDQPEDSKMTNNKNAIKIRIMKMGKNIDNKKFDYIINYND